MAPQSPHHTPAELNYRLKNASIIQQARKHDFPDGFWLQESTESYEIKERKLLHKTCLNKNRPAGVRGKKASI